MKKLMTALAVMALAGFTGLGVAATYEDEVRQRVSPVGKVCVQGDECAKGATQMAAASSASSEPRGGEAVYNAACMACHATGAAGAPKKGDKAAWAPRIEKGMETLVSHAINGFNAMPPKGGCANCSDAEIKNAVQYMVKASQ